MRKFVKGILIVSLLLFLTGTGCFIAGCVMGITSGDLVNALKQVPFIDFENGIILGKDKVFQVGPKDEFSGEEFVGSYRKEEVKRMHLDIEGVNCNIAVSDNENITVKVSDATGVKVNLQNGILDIDGSSSKYGNNSGEIRIYLPDGLLLDTFDFESGAGHVRIDCPIQAERFGIQAGASAIEAVGKISAQSVDIELGAGMIHLNMVDAKYIQVENGAGQTTIGLCGQKDQYKVNIESAAGNVQYGDETYAGIAKVYENNPKDADRTIQIESALGEVVVYFEEVI